MVLSFKFHVCHSSFETHWWSEVCVFITPGHKRLLISFKIIILPLILKHVQSNLERESSSLLAVNLGFTLFQAALQFKEGSLEE